MIDKEKKKIIAREVLILFALTIFIFLTLLTSLTWNHFYVDKFNNQKIELTHAIDSIGTELLKDEKFVTDPRYLCVFYSKYVKAARPDATIDHWLDRIKGNQEYKTGMHNEYVSKKSDISYEDWQSVLFSDSSILNSRASVLSDKVRQLDNITNEDLRRQRSEIDTKSFITLLTIFLLVLAYPIRILFWILKWSIRTVKND